MILSTSPRRSHRSQAHNVTSFLNSQRSHLGLTAEKSEHVDQSASKESKESLTIMNNKNGPAMAVEDIDSPTAPAPRFQRIR